MITNIHNHKYKFYLSIISLLLFVFITTYDIHWYLDSLMSYKQTSERTINSIIVIFRDMTYLAEIFYIVTLYAFIYLLLNAGSFFISTIYQGFSAYTATVMILILMIKIINKDHFKHIFSVHRVTMCIATIGSVVVIANITSKQQYTSWIDMAFDISIVSAIINTIMVLLFASYSKKYNALYTLATQDSLTGAFNRSAVYDIIEHHRSVGHRQMAVMFVDVDNFKRVNDRCGHRVGDQLLINLVNIIKSSLRETDSVIRWGGEEFVILCPMNNEDDLKRLAEKLRLSVAEDDTDLPDITVSIGAAIGMIHDIYDTVDNADKAVYASKSNGKNQVTLADSLFKKFNLTDFHKEFDENRVVFYGQPVYHHPTGSHLLIEFLIRIQIDDDIIPPSKFIYRFNKAVIEEPLLFKRFLDKLFAAFTLANSKLLVSKYSFNVHIDVLRKPENIDALLKFNKKCKELKITPVLEILEYESADCDSSVVYDFLNILRTDGMLFALDDFGVKDSNLLRLLTYKVDYVKLDMDFVQELTRLNKEKAYKVIRTVVTLINNLNPSNIIAEGVETSNQACLLADNLISNHQGYLYSKPFPIDHINKNHAYIEKT